MKGHIVPPLIFRYYILSMIGLLLNLSIYIKLDLSMLDKFSFCGTDTFLFNIYIYMDYFFIFKKLTTTAEGIDTQHGEHFSLMHEY
jgi:hypothetical protein